MRVSLCFDKRDEEASKQASKRLLPLLRCACLFGVAKKASFFVLSQSNKGAQA